MSRAALFLANHLEHRTREAHNTTVGLEDLFASIRTRLQARITKEEPKCLP